MKTNSHYLGRFFWLIWILTACNGAAVAPAASSPVPATPTSAPSVTTAATATETPVSPTHTPAAPQLEGWTTHQNTRYGFAFDLPPDAQVTAEQENYTRVDLQAAPGTNLVEKYLEITVLEGLVQCASPLAQGYEPGAIPKEPVHINGVEFIRESGSEGAVGNFYEFVSYSTQKGETCLSLGFVLHSTNAENYETPPPTYEAAGEMAIFDSILDTFRW